MSNILHLVLGCKNQHYSPIEVAAKETWVNTCPDTVKIIFMYGGHDSIFWDQKDSFYVDRPESYDHNICLYKTLTALKWFIKEDFNYVYRTNNTSYFDYNLIQHYLSDKPKTNFYSGIKGNHFGIQFASGSGYFISRDIVQKIVENMDILYSYNLEGSADDVAVGKFVTQYLNIGIDNSARRLNIVPNHVDNNLDLSHYHYRILNNGNVETLFKIHSLKSKSLEVL